QALVQRCGSIRVIVWLVRNAEIANQFQLVLDRKLSRREVQVLVFAGRRSHQNAAHVTLRPGEILSFVHWVASNVAQKGRSGCRSGPDNLRRLSAAVSADKRGRQEYPP